MTGPMSPRPNRAKHGGPGDGRGNTKPSGVGSDRCPTGGGIMTAPSTLPPRDKAAVGFPYPGFSGAPSSCRQRTLVPRRGSRRSSRVLRGPVTFDVFVFSPSTICTRVAGAAQPVPASFLSQSTIIAAAAQRPHLAQSPRRKAAFVPCAKKYPHPVQCFSSDELFPGRRR